MTETPEERGAKDALAIIGKWREGKSYSGLDLVGQGIVQSGGVGGGNLPAAAGAPAIGGVDLVEAGKGAAGPAIGSTIGAMAGSRFGLPGRLVGAGVGAGVGTLAGESLGALSGTGNPLMDALLAAGGAIGGQGVGEITTGVARTASRAHSRQRPPQARPVCEANLPPSGWIPRSPTSRRTWPRSSAPWRRPLQGATLFGLPLTDEPASSAAPQTTSWGAWRLHKPGSASR